MPEDGRAARTVTVGEALVEVLEAHGVELGFGVISLHNMPVLDAILRRPPGIRFIPARGEAGAMNMADAAARVSGRPALCLTSTGTGAGNAMGALIEALTAGTPLVHLTGQIDTPWLDRGWGFIHEAKDQLAMLRACGKAAFRVSRPEDARAVLREALRVALTPPTGPVSVEIPIDIQQAPCPPGDVSPLPLPVLAPDPRALERARALLAAARRPVLLAGGGARHAGEAVAAFADAGVPVVTSVNGRGVIPEDHPACLGAFATSPSVAALLAESDCLIVAGSRLRSNETRSYGITLPRNLIRVDADPASSGRGYPEALLLVADAAAALSALADAARPEAGWLARGTAAREAAVARTKQEAGAYAALIAALEARLPEHAPWVRDITLSNSIWGNRLPPLSDPRQGVHALGGGIGQGLAHAIGAALARPGVKTVALCGDGGFMLNPGELATAVETGCDLMLLLMNDGGYGVIRNIQDAAYGGRRGFTDLMNPDFAALVRAFGARHAKAADAASLAAAMDSALARRGVDVIEVDMHAFGAFGIAFAGPPKSG
jgi:acetolactate synthase-1/2/3 large subunit